MLVPKCLTDDFFLYLLSFTVWDEFAPVFWFFWKNFLCAFHTHAHGLWFCQGWGGSCHLCTGMSLTEPWSHGVQINARLPVCLCFQYNSPKHSPLFWAATRALLLNIPLSVWRPDRQTTYPLNFIIHCFEELVTFVSSPWVGLWFKWFMKSLN